MISNKTRAGRPPLGDRKRRSKHFKLPPDVCDWLESQDDQTAAVERAIRATYELSIPEGNEYD